MTEAVAETPVPEPRKSIWTKEMRAHARKADRVLFIFEPREPGTSQYFDPQPCIVEFLYEEHKVKGEPYRPERRVQFKMRGWIRGGRGDKQHVSNDGFISYESENNLYQPETGIWSFSLYQKYGCTSTTALLMLPIGAEIKFEVKLDAHSNGHCARHLLHGDTLVANWKQGGEDRTLELDNAIGKMDTARFGWMR